MLRDEKEFVSAVEPHPSSSSSSRCYVASHLKGHVTPLKKRSA